MVALLALWAAAAPLRADVCVWRDPERTMTKLFPTARDYRTVTRRITPELATRIEEQAGVRLDKSEREEFNFYEITGRVRGRSQRIGTVMALAGKGEYGVIEVVIGLDTEDRIVDVYIQRIRERQAEKLRSGDFLGQFRGKSKAEPLEVGRDIRSVSEAKTASHAITLAIKKMVVFYDVLTKEDL